MKPLSDGDFLKKSREPKGLRGFQYHVHPQLRLTQDQTIDSAINIGSSNVDDLMFYKLLLNCAASELPDGIPSLLEGLDVGVTPLNAGALDYVAQGLTTPGGWFQAPPLLLPQTDDDDAYDNADLLNEALVAHDVHVQLLDTIFTQAAVAQETVYVLGYEQRITVR